MPVEDAGAGNPFGWCGNDSHIEAWGERTNA